MVNLGMNRLYLLGGGKAEGQGEIKVGATLRLLK